jgi:hypothetical protein
MVERGATMVSTASRRRCARAPSPDRRLTAPRGVRAAKGRTERVAPGDERAPAHLPHASRDRVLLVAAMALQPAEVDGAGGAAISRVAGDRAGPAAPASRTAEPGDHVACPRAGLRGSASARTRPGGWQPALCLADPNSRLPAHDLPRRGHGASGRGELPPRVVRTVRAARSPRHDLPFRAKLDHDRRER